jgi:uracil-DNA glycosylase
MKTPVISNTSNPLLDHIVSRQIEFQQLVKFNIMTEDSAEANALAQRYLMKMYEEVSELAKTQPNGIENKSHVAEIVRQDMLWESIDIFLFLLNFLILRRVSLDEFLTALNDVQTNNFSKIKTKFMGRLNQEMMGVANERKLKIGLGRGPLDARFIFIGQNAAQTVNHGEEVFATKYKDDRTAGGVLLPLLEDAGVLDYCYFTNAVKAATKDNKAPAADEQEFWLPFLNRELQILLADNPEARVIPMGAIAKKMTGRDGIRHPAVIYRGVSVDDYKKEVLSALY